MEKASPSPFGASQERATTADVRLASDPRPPTRR